MNKIIVSILLIAVLFVAACGSAPADEPSHNEVLEEAERSSGNPATGSTRVINANVASEEHLGELQSSFSVDTVDYVRSKANEYGDESATRRIKGTKLYTLESVVNYKYNPSSNLAGKTIYYELRGTDLNEEQTKVVSSGVLEEGSNSLNVEFIILHTGDSPKMNFCFDNSKTVGDDNCYSFSSIPVNNDLTVNSDNIKMDADASKNIIIRNDGTAPLTAFVHAPAGEDAIIRVSDTTVTLDGGEQAIVTITTESKEDGVDVNEDHMLNVYAIPDGCSLSNTCGNSARIKNKIELEVD